MRERMIFCWSGGKDSARALYEIERTGDLEVVTLLTTVTRDYERISMHGVRQKLLEEQALALGFPLEIIYLPSEGGNEAYEDKMREVLLGYCARGVRTVGFGDIFLEDLKKYREANLSKIGMKAVFPLWGRDTRLLSREFVQLGFKAVIVCADSKSVGEEFAGMEFDHAFLEKLPATVDPCGENGEFHSFVYDGPNFKKKIALQKGERVFRENRFYFQDFLPLDETAVLR